MWFFFLRHSFLYSKMQFFSIYFSEYIWVTHTRSRHRTFLATQFVLVSFSHVSSPSLPEANPGCCHYIGIILPLLELHINGVTHMYSFDSSFFHSKYFWNHTYLDVSAICSRVVIHCTNISQICLLFPLLMDIWVVSSFGCCEWGFHGHSDRCFCG